MSNRRLGPQPANELQADLAAVEVAVEVENERLDRARPVVEGGADADAGSRHAALARDVRPRRVDAVGGDGHPDRDLQVGCGEPERPAAALSRHDRPAQRVVPSQQLRRGRDVAFGQRVADVSAPNRTTDVVQQRLDNVQREPDLGAEGRERLDVALPVVSHREVGPHDQVPHPDAAPEQNGELAGRQPRQLDVEGYRQQELHADLPYQAQPLVQRGQVPSFEVGAQHRCRVVLQREHDGRSAGLAGDLPEAAQQVPVTPVNPVEDADGHGGIPSVPLLCDRAIGVHA